MSEHKEKTDIIQDLLNEFSRDKAEFKTKYDTNRTRIEEIEKDIEELQYYDDDRQIFSPRNLTTSNDIRLIELQKEKDSLNEENLYLFSKIKYFEEKINALEDAVPEQEQVETQDKQENSLEKDPLEQDIIAENLNDNINNKDQSLTDLRSLSDNQTGEKITNERNDSDKLSMEIKNNTSSLCYIDKEILEKVLYKLNLSLEFLEHDRIRSSLEIKSVIQLLKDLS